MTIYIKILYNDLSQESEEIGNVADITKDNVLFILIENDERKGSLKNMTSSFGFDNYTLCQKKDGGQDWIMLFGWDDDDFIWRRLTTEQATESVDLPIGVMHIIFHGISVSQEVWENALEIFNGEMI